MQFLISVSNVYQKEYLNAGRMHNKVVTTTSKLQESPAVADKPARRLPKICTVYVGAVGL